MDGIKMKPKDKKIEIVNSPEKEKTDKTKSQEIRGDELGCGSRSEA